MAGDVGEVHAEAVPPAAAPRLHSAPVPDAIPNATRDGMAVGARIAELEAQLATARVAAIEAQLAKMRQVQVGKVWLESTVAPVDPAIGVVTAAPPVTTLPFATIVPELVEPPRTPAASSSSAAVTDFVAPALTTVGFATTPSLVVVISSTTSTTREVDHGVLAVGPEAPDISESGFQGGLIVGGFLVGLLLFTVFLCRRLLRATNSKPRNGYNHVSSKGGYGQVGQMAETMDWATDEDDDFPEAVALGKTLAKSVREPEFLQVEQKPQFVPETNLLDDLDLC